MSFLLQIQIPVLNLACRPCSVMQIPTSPLLPATLASAGAGHLSGVPRDSCRWSQRPWLRGGGLLAGPPRPSSRAPGVASPLSPSLLCGLPPQPNQPSASEVKSCQTWRRLPALSQVLASQRKANYKNGNFQTSVQWYSNRRLGSTQAQTAFVLFCD